MLTHTGQQVGLAFIVQLAEHIVQQQHRVFAKKAADHAGLGQFHGQYAAALLALAAKHACRLVIQFDFQIFAVWSRQTEPGAQLCVFDRFQFFRQRVCGGEMCIRDSW